MPYLFFDGQRDNDFEVNDKSEKGTLGEHLSYIERGGSPDCWLSTDTDSRSQAMSIAEKSGLHLYVVDETKLRVVGQTNEPKGE